MDISKMSVTELKALAYDQVAELERVQKNLHLINAEIEKKLKAEPKAESLDLEDKEGTEPDK